MLNGEKSPKFEFSSPEKPIAFGQWGEASTAREKVLWYEPLESLMINLLHCVFTINTLRGIGGSRCASVRNCFHWGTPLNSHRYTSPIHWFCIGNIFCWWLWLQFQFILNPLQIPELVVHLKNLKASPTLLACGSPQPEEWEQQRWERGQSEIDASTTSQQQQLENIQLLGKLH